MDVQALIKTLNVSLGLEIVAGKEGLDRQITATTIQKPGLALAGYTEMLKPGRIQILGSTEIDYLWSLDPHQRLTATKQLFEWAPPAVVVTRGMDIPDQLITCADQHRVPLLATSLRSSLFVEALHKVLANRLARIRSIHGVLVDVYGVGVLITGKSGIGKSECALDLVMRGHRLVADDVVDVSLVPPSTVIGAGNELIQHHMEIRGLGIISIKDLFGVAAIRETKRVELVVAMEEWDAEKQYDRLGINTETHEILGVNIPQITIPIRPGRTLTTIVEVAARNQILKTMGHHSAKEFRITIDANLTAERDTSPRTSTMPHGLSHEINSDDVE